MIETCITKALGANMVLAIKDGEVWLLPRPEYPGAACKLAEVKASEIEGDPQFAKLKPQSEWSTYKSGRYTLRSGRVGFLEIGLPDDGSDYYLMAQ